MADEILIWRDQLEAEKEDSKRCKAPAIKANWLELGWLERWDTLLEVQSPHAFGGGGLVGGHKSYGHKLISRQ